MIQLHNKIIKTIALSIVAAMVMLAAMSSPVCAQDTLKAVIVDGQNNHDWQACTPVLKDILQNSGIFKVDVATSPPKGKPMDDFKPAFSRYDVVVLNYTGDAWPKDTQEAFVDYVRSGGGVVVVHAANNAFPKWEEFNEIIGLGGWGGRNEKSGPMVRYRDGKVVRDTSPGRGGTHGPQRAYHVEIRDPDHPITKGLPEKWLHAKDELYAQLRGPAKNLHLLATSLSKKTNEHEPVLFTIRYGEGRIFHTVLGHGPYAMNCAGFAFTLQRGFEWAATGKVTLADVPANFPTEDEVRFRLQDVSIDEIKSYGFGTSRKALTTLEENIRNASEGQQRQIEQQMIKLIQAEDATFEAKQFACRMLRRIGSEASLRVLGRLLRNEELSNMARFALQGMASPKVDPILRKALDELEGDLRIGIIGTIAQRGDQKAVRLIARYLGSEDKNLARTAISALGQIGGAGAARALARADVADEFDQLRYDSILLCADQLAESDNTARAISIYKRMTNPALPTMIRLAAYRGLVGTDKDNAVPTLVSMIKKDEPEFHNAAVGPLLRLIPGSKVTAAMMDAFPGLSDELKEDVLIALANRGDKSVVPKIVEILPNQGPSVQTAALKALAMVGGARQVPMLAEYALKDGEVGSVAQFALNNLKGEAADQSILELAKQGDDKLKPTLLRSLNVRRTDGAVDVFKQYALHKNDEIRREAVIGLTKLASSNDIPALLDLIVQMEDQNAIDDLQKAIVTLAESMQDNEKRTTYFVSALDKAPKHLRVTLIDIMGEFGGERAAKAVKNIFINDDDQNVRKAAFDALVSWPDAAPIDTLLDTAKRTSIDATRQSALKGYLRMITLLRTDSFEDALKKYQTAMDVADNAEEKAMVIEAVGQRTHVAVLDFLESYLDDSDVGEKAVAAYKEVVRQLESTDADRDAWTLKASHNNGSIKNAIDGDMGSRWDTGTPQKPGMWFQIDLGAERVIEEIKLDTTGSNGDYPRGYEVYLSFNGEDWGKPVAEGKGDGPVTVVSIPSKSARYIKIVQTGQVDGLFWSIHELTLKVTGNKAKLKHAHEVLEKLESKE